jgi:hypothetical protein
VTKRLSKVRFKGGELALRECDELGQVSYYALSGEWLGSAKGLCEIVEELGTFNSEFEFLLLLGRRPAVYTRTCDACGELVLMIVEDGGGACRNCGRYMDDIADNYLSALGLGTAFHSKCDDESIDAADSI